MARVTRWSLALAFAVCAGTGAARAQTNLAAGDPQAQFQLTAYAQGIMVPTDIAFLPDGRAIILEQRTGNIVFRRADGTLDKTNKVTIPGNVGSEQGLLGVAVHPEFNANKTIFLFASVGQDGARRNRVLRATIADDSKVTVDYAAPVVDQLETDPMHGAHNGGALAIHDGHLYLSVGDTTLAGVMYGTGLAPQNKYGSCLNKPNGKILRVGLDGTVPADNPLVDVPMVTSCDTPTGAFGMAPPDKRIFAWGLRNPWRFWIDSKTGLLWIADVGSDRKEEVNVGGKGMHFGWPFFEGTHAYTTQEQPWSMGCKGMTPSVECTAPAYEYDGKTISKMPDNCIVGGLILDACSWPAEYRGRYLFGDHGSGNVYLVDVTADRKGVDAASRKLFATFTRGMTSFRLGPDQALYVTADGTNAVYRIAPRNPAPPSQACEYSPAPDAGAPADAATGTGGRAGAGGGGGTAGAAGGSGGRTGMGGAAGGNGSAGAGGTGGAAPTTAGTSSEGCGCRLDGTGRSSALGALVLLAFALGLRRRAR